MRIRAQELGQLARALAFHTAFHTPLRQYLPPRYQYLHTPAQLAFLCRCLDETRDIPGCIVEVGCYRGETTLYLNYHMTSEGIEKPYAAIDTFSGYKRADLDVDVQYGTHPDVYPTRFEVNDQRWFDAAMLRSGFTRGRVRSIAADAGAFDFARLGPIAFCLSDVVLDKPTRLGLPRIWDALSPGGIIVVDSVDPSLQAPGCYFGSCHAYHDFVEELGLDPRFECRQYGVLTKQP